MTSLFDSLYVLDEGWGRGAVRVHLVEPMATSNVLEVFRGLVAPNEPLRFVVDEGTEFPDFVGTTEVVFRLVSERAIALLNEAGFSGWQTFPAEISNAPKRYRGLAVTAKVGPPLPQVSKSELAPPLAPGLPARRIFRGLYFDTNTWGGADFSSPEGTAVILVRQRVKDLLEQQSVTNCRFERVSEVERSLTAAEIAASKSVERGGL